MEKLFFFIVGITIFGIFGSLLFAGEVFWAWFCDKWDKYARKKYNKRHNKESMET